MILMHLEKYTYFCDILVFTKFLQSLQNYFQKSLLLE